MVSSAKDSYLPILLLGTLVLSGCASDWYEAKMVAERERQAQLRHAFYDWQRGAWRDTCFTAPTPRTERACLANGKRTLARLRGESMTRDDHYRLQLLMAQAVDEVVSLRARSATVEWLRGPRTLACKKAPTQDVIRQCLEGVEADVVNWLDPEFPAGPAEVRAERAVARIEARERELAIERQHHHEMDLARTQAAGQALLGFGVGGGFSNGLRNATAPAPVYQPQPTPVLPLTSPLRSQPPVSCSSRQVGGILQTDCY
jgi:hypothetical protein